MWSAHLFGKVRWVEKLKQWVVIVDAEFIRKCLHPSRIEFFKKYGDEWGCKNTLVDGNNNLIDSNNILLPRLEVIENNKKNETKYVILMDSLTLLLFEYYEHMLQLSVKKEYNGNVIAMKAHIASMEVDYKRGARKFNELLRENIEEFKILTEELTVADRLMIDNANNFKLDSDTKSKYKEYKMRSLNILFNLCKCIGCMFFLFLMSLVKLQWFLV